MVSEMLANLYDAKKVLQSLDIPVQKLVGLVMNGV
jgi:hypothetical protein